MSIEIKACCAFDEQAKQQGLVCQHSVGMMGCTYILYKIDTRPSGASVFRGKVAEVFVRDYSRKSVEENVELIWQGYVEQQIAGDE